MLKALEIVAVLCAAVFAVALFCLIILYSSQPSSEPKQQQSSEKYETGQNKRELRESFWQRTTQDPIAFFTLWLAIFTMILSAVAVLQIKFLVRGEGIADKTAQAAKDSADVAKRTFTELERPYIFIDPPKFVPSPINGNPANVQYLLKNYGRTPGILIWGL
ncbi:MAG: hypothetical protein WBW81_08730 [Methylocella sp.]